VTTEGTGRRTTGRLAALEIAASRREPMPRPASKIASLAALMVFMLANAAVADDMGGESIEVPPPAQPSAVYDEAPVEGDADGWHYCSYYILPLTRHMRDSGIPLVGRIFMYPLAAAFDLVQLPFGAIAGLAGE